MVKVGVTFNGSEGLYNSRYLDMGSRSNDHWIPTLDGDCETVFMFNKLIVLEFYSGVCNVTIAISAVALFPLDILVASSTVYDAQK